jgi:membrane protein DedA with SNARE-associated domain
MSALLVCLGLGGILTLEEAGLFLLPGDISLVAAGVHFGQGSLVILVISWAVASLAMVAGASVLFYGVGRSRRLERVLPDRVRRLVRYHGLWGVTAARLVPGLRNATVFAASSANLPYRTFLSGLAPASAIWSGLLLGLGWLGGAAFLAAFHAVHSGWPVQVASAGLLLGAAGFVVIRVRSGSITPTE